MTLLIVPILIRVGAGVLSRGAGVAIARWAGGSVVKRAIATAAADKIIDEAKDFLSEGSSKWERAFREDPKEAFKTAVGDIARGTIGNLSLPEIPDEVAEQYSDGLMKGMGRDAIASLKKEADGAIAQIDPDRAIRDTTSEIIARGLEWAEPKQVIESDRRYVLNRDVIGGESAIEPKSIIEEASRRAFYDSFDPAALNYSVVGSDDLFKARVQSPIELATKQIFDIEVRSL